MNVLFICRANVGRSQMAAALFNKYAEGKHLACSAGTKVDVEGQKLKDRETAENVLKSLDEVGIDARENVRTQLTEPIAQTADYIVSMVERDTLPDYLQTNSNVRYWSVVDPFGQSLQFTRDRRDEIEQKVKELVNELG